MYEAHFKRGPWATGLKMQVTRRLIEKFPAAFPRSMLIKYEPTLNDCIQQLLEKDPQSRLGSQRLEAEVLEHDYF